MLDEILEADSLGDRDQIEYMLEVAESGSHTVASLMEACFARSYGFRRSFRGLLRLLSKIGYLSIDGDSVNVDDSSYSELRAGFLEPFCQRLFESIADVGVLHHLFNTHTLSVDASNQLIYFKNNLVPIRYASLRNLLISLGLLNRVPNMRNVFVLASEHYVWFQKGIIDWTCQSEEHQGQTLKQLKAQLRNKEHIGRLAEEYVVAFEKRRLVDHPEVESVRMISDQAAGAGYDIVSFEGQDSMLFDRFIEVKSFAGDESFYWSANEIRVAKDKGQSYFLCLVNRDEMDRIDYTPTFVQDPAQSIFSDKRWEHSCETFFFSRK